MRNRLLLTAKQENRHYFANDAKAMAQVDKCQKNHAKYEQSLWVKNMAKKCGGQKYSEEEMEALRKNPNVLEVLENRLSLTIEFRQQV